MERLELWHGMSGWQEMINEGQQKGESIRISWFAVGARMAKIGS